MSAPAAPPGVRPVAAPVWVGPTGYAVALGLLFAPAVARLAHLWDTDANYSHGYLVPLVSLWAAVGVARRTPVPAAGDPRLAVVALLLGLTAHLAAVVFRWPPLDFVGLFFALRAGLLAVGGPGYAQRFLFPLGFLALAVPLPVTWTGTAALWLQDVVSRSAEAFLSIFMVVYRQGHTLHLAGMDQSLTVAEECSGVRQLVAFVTFAVFYGHLVNRSTGGRIALAVLAVPIAVLANTARVVLMYLGAYWAGTNWLSGTLHDAPAAFTLPLGLLLFLAADRLLKTDKGTRGQGDKGTEPGTEAADASVPLSPCPLVPLSAWILLSAVALGGWAAEHLLERHLAVAGEASYPAFRSLADLPANPGGWATVPDAGREADVRGRIPYPHHELIVRRFQQGGLGAELFAIATRDGQDRRHHPEVCVREVAGAPEDLSARAAVPLGGPERVAQRFRFVTGPGRAMVVYYWHYTLIPNEDPTRTTVQRLHQRLAVPPPSLTAQLTVPDPDPSALAAVEQTLLPALDRALADRLPPAVVGRDRLPIGLDRTP